MAEFSNKKGRLTFAARDNGSGGMTLVELMVAVSIFTLVFFMLLDFFRQGVSLNKSAEIKGDNLQQTRLSLIEFEKDIREAIELIDFDDNERYTNIQLVRNKIKATGLDYIIYTLYKYKQNVAGKDVPFSLCRNVLASRPAITDVAIDPVIKAVEMVEGQVGIVAKAADGKGHEIKTEIAAYNMNYDPSLLNIPLMPYEDKEKERQVFRYLGKNGGNVVGFNDKKKIVSLELTFITKDQQKIINVFRSLVYIRKLYYDKLTDKEF